MATFSICPSRLSRWLRATVVISFWIMRANNTRTATNGSRPEASPLVRIDAEDEKKVVIGVTSHHQYADDVFNQDYMSSDYDGQV